jgi:hypothetical protein
VDALRRLKITVPQSEGKLLSQIDARAHVLRRVFKDSAVQMEVDAPESLARVLDRYVAKTRSKSHHADAQVPRKAK